MNHQRFRCPVCGQTVTVHITPVTDPTCTHRGTRHDRHRHRTMTTRRRNRIMSKIDHLTLKFVTRVIEALDAIDSSDTCELYVDHAHISIAGDLVGVVRMSDSGDWYEFDTDGIS